MKTQTIVVIILAIIVVGAVFYAMNASAGPTRVVVALTDAAADMGTVSSVQITVDKVEIHSDSEGWIVLSNISRTYDLLELKADGKQVVLADVNISEGSYQQLRLHVSEVVVVDENGSHEAKLPSGEIKVVGGFNVSANTTQTAVFDFIADESLHITGNGQYIFAPVVQVETREDAEVEIDGEGEVEINSGRIKTNVKVGMDENGNVDVGLKIPSQVGLSLGSDNKVKIGNENRNEVSVNVSTGVGLGL